MTVTYEPTFQLYGWGTPDLFVRNNTSRTITGNSPWLKWELPPSPNPDYIGPLPWDVAVSPGFQRVWEKGQVTVGLDENFEDIITELPVGPGVTGPFKPVTFVQSVPQSVVELVHNFNRAGPVMVSIRSLDGAIEWDEFTKEEINPNTVRVSFEDPITFRATVF